MRFTHLRRGSGDGIEEYSVEQTARATPPICHAPWYALAQETFAERVSEVVAILCHQIVRARREPARSGSGSGHTHRMACYE